MFSNWCVFIRVFSSFIYKILLNELFAPNVPVLSPRKNINFVWHLKWGRSEEEVGM